MNTVALIARREIVTRLQQKSYRIGFGIAMLIAIVGCALPALFSGDTKSSSYDIGLSTQPAERGKRDQTGQEVRAARPRACP